MAFSCSPKSAKAALLSRYVEDFKIKKALSIVVCFGIIIKPRVPLFCSYHTLMSSVICYSTDPRQPATWNLFLKLMHAEGC